MRGSPFGFVDVVVNDRDLAVTSAYEHACRLEPRVSDLAWYCDLDDGTPTGESDPASWVRWVCPALRVGRSVVGPAVEVRRTGPQSDLGKLLRSFARLAGRADPPTGDASGESRYAYSDPAGILDDALRRRIETWPTAPHGDGVVRPAELASIRRTGEGLVVASSSWWDSAPVLDHQIGLAIDIAHRLADRR